MDQFLIERLASVGSSIAYSDLSPEMIHQTKRNILDGIGCALGAYRLKVNPELVHYYRQLGGNKEASVLGYGFKLPVEHAALLNGMLTTHLEFDSTPAPISAALPAAEFKQSSGPELMTAIAVGFICANVLKSLLATEIERHGFHWPAQLSTIYSTASVSKLWDGGAGHMARAMSFSGALSPVAPYEAFVKGGRVKVFYGGWPCFIAALSSKLCGLGFSGPLSILEGSMALGQAWRHQKLKNEDFEKALEAATSPNATYMGYKYYPTNTCALGPLTACKNLLEKHPYLDINQIERVRVGTYAYSFLLSTQSSADNAIGSKANIPFLCAAMLRDHQVLPEHTELPMLNDPELHAMAARIDVFQLPDTDTDHRVRHRPATVEIYLTNGQCLKESVSDPIWRVDSAPDDGLEAKFHQLAGDIMPVEKRTLLIKTIWELDSVSDISEIAPLFKVDP